MEGIENYPGEGALQVVLCLASPIYRKDASLLVFKVDEVSSIWLASEVLPNRLEQAMSKHNDSTPPQEEA